MKASQLGSVRGAVLAWPAFRHPAGFAIVLVAAAAPTAALAADLQSSWNSEAVFIAELGLLLLVGRLTGEAAQRLGQPAVMGQLIGGLLLGPTVLGVVWPAAQPALFPSAAEQKSMINAISQLGILMLLLLTGMETDLQLVKRVGRAAVTGAAGGASAQAGRSPGHRDLSRHGAVDLFGEDRGDGGARDGFHAPRSRPDYRRLGHSRGHDGLDHHRHRTRPGVGWLVGSLVGRTRRLGDGVVHDRKPDDRQAHRVQSDP